jgi:hypothetical protein
MAEAASNDLLLPRRMGATALIAPWRVDQHAA